MIDFTCDCGKPLRAREEHAGQRTRCPDCGRELIIPTGSTAIEPVPSAPARRGPARLPEPDYDVAPGPVVTSGKAVASLVLGLLTPLLCILTGLPAVILGILG